jgi:hypothetical protein
MHNRCSPSPFHEQTSVRLSIASLERNQSNSLKTNRAFITRNVREQDDGGDEEEEDEAVGIAWEQVDDE